VRGTRPATHRGRLAPADPLHGGFDDAGRGRGEASRGAPDRLAAGGRFVGIVTDTDLLACLARVVVGEGPSSRLEIVLPPQRPPLADIVRILESLGAPVSSVLVVSGRHGPIQVIVRLGTLDAGAAIGALRAAGYAARLAPQDVSS
jgi:hypothetical protein